LRGPKERTTGRARELRQFENDAEERLWSELRNRRLNGFKFVRQFPIGPYFADFTCRDARLVVEVDGSQHADSDHDRRRDAFMNAAGWSVARFWNVDVLADIAPVLETIVAILDGRLMDRTISYDFNFAPARKS
jgi:very-short-patch-repair endonuclease